MVPKLLRLLLLVCCLGIGNLYAQIEMLVIGNGFEKENLDYVVAGYRDTAHTATIAQNVLETKHLQTWEIVSPGAMINMGYSRDTWWLHWELLNNTPKSSDLVLYLGSGIIDEIVLYAVYDSAGNTVIDSFPPTGVSNPYKQAFFDSKGWSYPITLPPGKRVQYWLKLRNNIASLRVPLQLWQRADYMRHLTMFNIGWGVFFGILLLTIIGAIAVFVATRQFVFLSYAAYIGSLILLNGITLGFHIIILGLDNPFLAHTYVFVVSVVVVVSMIIFCKIYLDINRWAPKLNYLVYLNVATLVIMAFLWFVWPDNLSISEWLIHIFTFLPLISLITILGFVIAQKPIPPQHWLFLIAFTPLVLLSIGMALRNNGIIGHSIIFDIRLPISFAFEAVVFSYALALRIRDMRNEREQLLQQVNIQQRDSFRTVIEATEKERKRVAEDLHDGLGQLLSTAKLNLTAIELPQNPEEHSSIETSLSLLDEACQEVRHISHNMMPGTLIRLGLVSAVKEQARKINESGKILVTVTISGFEKRMDETREIAMYRVIQEILNNSIRYASATDIEIRLEQLADGYLFRIKDNGKGFDPKVLEQSKGIGWRNIRSRVDLLQGNIDLKTAPGKGTVLNIWVP